MTPAHAGQERSLRSAMERICDMTKNFTGVIIEESLGKKDILKKVKILKTKIEKVTPEHHTPHLSQWTLHTVEIPKNKSDEVAKELSLSLETQHGHWYADFKNDNVHYIIFYHKIFKVPLSHPEAYKEIREYGLSLGIPAHQLDFSEQYTSS